MRKVEIKKYVKCKIIHQTAPLHASMFTNNYYMAVFFYCYFDETLPWYY